MQAWVIVKISIVWVVFISRIRCAIKAGIRSVAEQKLKAVPAFQLLTVSSFSNTEVFPAS